MKPLTDKKLLNDKVMCIDFGQEMAYVVSGYESGAIVLWDVKTYKLVKIMDEVHYS